MRQIKFAASCVEWSVWTELRGGGPFVCFQKNDVSHHSLVARWPTRRSPSFLAVSGRNLEVSGSGSRAFCRSSLPRSTLFLSPMVRILYLSEVSFNSRRIGASFLWNFFVLPLHQRPTGKSTVCCIRLPGRSESCLPWPLSSSAFRVCPV